MAIPPETAIFLGQLLDRRFEVRAFMAPGGFGYVYEGYDRAVDRPVAIKVLKPAAGTSGVLEFDTECKLLAKASSATNIVSMIAEGQTTVTLTAAVTGAVIPIACRYVVLELADGTLSDVIVNLGRIDWEERLTLFRQVVLGFINFIGCTLSTAISRLRTSCSSQVLPQRRR
jgi:serine/threonine-protein kinase